MKKSRLILLIAILLAETVVLFFVIKRYTYHIEDTSAEAKAKAYSLFGEFGSATYISDRTLVVSIFTSDNETSWDFDNEDDLALRGAVYSGTAIACEWIAEQAKSYGTQTDFLYDWEEYGDLVYTAELNGDANRNALSGIISEASWRCIDETVDSEALLEKYDAKNIVYMMYFNIPKTDENGSCSIPYFEGMSYPYETAYVIMNDASNPTCPAIIAHEMLHLFGAPDLYTAVDYGITDEYVEYIADIETNDIMRATTDRATGERLHDRITNEITDITAYYVGLTDYSETVAEWGFDKNQYQAAEERETAETAGED
jgi:hypothetical protein